jgi:hypothetical protein
VAGELPEIERPGDLVVPPKYIEGIFGGPATVWIPLPRFGRQGTLMDKGFQDLLAVGFVIVAVIIVYSGAATHPIMALVVILLVVGAVALVLDPPDPDPAGSRMLTAAWSWLPQEVRRPEVDALSMCEGLPACVDRMYRLVDEYVIASEKLQGTEARGDDAALRLHLADNWFQLHMAADGMAHVLAFELARTDLLDAAYPSDRATTEFDAGFIHRVDAMRGAGSTGGPSIEQSMDRISDPTIRFALRAALRELGAVDVAGTVRVAGLSGGVAALQGAVTWVR